MYTALTNSEWETLCKVLEETDNISDKYLETFNREFQRRNYEDDLIQKWNEEYARLKKVRREH